jgi:molybdopterin converting factor subunit 1
MRVRVRYFAYFRERLGRSHDQLDVPEGCGVQALWQQCTGDDERLAALWPVALVAINGEYAGHEAVLSEGDEVAFLPPISGGAAHCRLTDQPLDVAAVEAAVGASRHGAVVSFVGVVRERSDGGAAVRYLEYEAFDQMALREMEALAGVTEERWPGCSLAIEHRVGRLGIGEASVVIAVAAPHRAEAFEACRFAIDRLKETVPIWKKEVFADGSQWVGMGA